MTINDNGNIILNEYDRDNFTYDSEDQLFSFIYIGTYQIESMFIAYSVKKLNNFISYVFNENEFIIKTFIPAKGKFEFFPQYMITNQILQESSIFRVNEKTRIQPI